MRSAREEWERLAGERRREAARSRLPELRSLAQAQVAESRLTGSAEWDSFLKLIQALRDEAHGAHEACKSAFASGEYLSHDQLLNLKLHAERTLARVSALDEVMALPKAMREAGKKAAALVREAESDA